MLGTKGAMAWFGLLVILCCVSWFQVTHHWRLQTDVLALLPKSEQDPAMQSLRQIASGTLGRTALFLVGHDRSQTARGATQQLGTWMEESALFKTVQWDYSRQRQAFFDLYFPLRYRILSPRIRRHLSTTDGYQALMQRLKQTLYQPTSALATRFLHEDPLLFFPALIQDWGQQSSQLSLDDGLLARQHGGHFYYVITAQLAFNPFETQGQTQFDHQWSSWVRTLHQTWPNLKLMSTSVARFATASRKSIHRDIALISIGSLLGVTLLTISTFRTLKHLLLALMPLAVGIWSALGLSLWLFGEIHALTLTFGASLIGICIDYSFHYFAHHRVATQWHATQTMRQILPALGLGALTTVLSYLSLALTPLVGLQQIAVFASCGIIVSFGTVVFVLPCLLQHTHSHAQQAPMAHVSAQWWFTLWQRCRKPLLAACALATVLCLPGLLSLPVSDSPRALNALPHDLTAQDRLIRQIMGVAQSQTYLIVEGRTAEEALQKLEALHELMRLTADNPVAQWGPILTSFLPSIKQQEADLAATRTLLGYRSEMTREFAQLGFAKEAIDHFFQTIQHPPAPLLRPETWLQHDASIGLRHLWLDNTAHGASILVQLRRIHNIRKLEEMIATVDGVHYVDQVQDFTRVFKRYRHQAMRLAGGAYLLIFGLLLWRYGKRGIVLMLPPLLSALIAVSILGLLGHPFHLIHCLALLLILGMGVDYTIFVAESPPAAGPTTLLALILSALTTLLSFGLLSLSSQAILQAIGLTTLIGIAVALLLAPIAQYGRTTS